jgi:hypothetical protein
MKASWNIAGCLCILLAWRGQSMAGASAPDPVIFNLKQELASGMIAATSDAKITLVRDSALQLETGRHYTWPGLTLKAPQGKWDWSSFEYVSFTLKNLGANPVTVFVRVDNPGADGRRNCLTDRLALAPETAGILKVNLSPTLWRISEPIKLVGMRAAPGYSELLDPARVTQVLVYVDKPRTNHVFELADLRVGGRATVLEAKSFFPFIDELGQFIHAEWPGKTHSAEELQACREAEEKDLAAHPGPVDRSQYGGWTGGPKLQATGFFRVEKHRGKWWLVDPEGWLFWSHGIDCVGMANTTPITDRDHYFRQLPKTNSALAKFYGAGRWAPHGYYKDHSPYRTYDFSRSNLVRKYGDDWPAVYAERTHRRLKSWGLNTIGNWSDSRTCLLRKTPYVCTISFEAKPLEGSQGYWGKFFDVFDPSFRQGLRQRLQREQGASAGDPWCLGYFVHNELSWGDEVSLAVAALLSPPDQPAKQVFIDDLKARYQTVEKLNVAWGAQYASWDALLQAKQSPDVKKAHSDLTAFYSKIAETYFRIVREELKKVAPIQLYLGCRFAWVNDRAARAAAKFCDVVSYNRYEYSVEKLRLPDNLDLSVIIGEFHFGALDRGMFHTGLRKTDNQTDRAAKYSNYVLGALRNPHIVGTHWFQYQDQATTGRGDGENYQIGFVDICDTPYPETIQASRLVGSQLFEYRLKD